MEKIFQLSIERMPINHVSEFIHYYVPKHEQKRYEHLVSKRIPPLLMTPQVEKKSKNTKSAGCTKHKRSH